MKRERDEKSGLGSRKKPKEDDSYYFDSYSHLDIHEEMIRDKARTETYRKAMKLNPTDFKDQVVLDVGCGTGILSIFAVQAGAKHVYAVDACDVVDAAQSLVDHNQLSDKITIIKGKIEEITLPVDKVDIIISEWMGYFLVYESMLESVFFARDKWLRKGGKMYPSHAHIWLSPFSNDSFYKDRVYFWGKMYGIDFTPLQVHAKKTVFLEPQIEYVPVEGEISFPTKAFTIDLETDKYEDIKSFSMSNMHGIMGYFSVDFAGSDKTVTLSTGPTSSNTHWYQTLFFFEDAVLVGLDSQITAKLDVSPLESNPRCLQVELECSVENLKVKRSYEFK